MNKKFFHLPSVSRCVVAASVAVLLSLYATGAYAAAGCNEKVMEAMQKKAEAKVAQDVAVTESVISKPDSVLAMSCFNQTAGTLAGTGGKIFSGDFTQQLAPLVTEGLNSFFDDFAGSSGFNSFLQTAGGNLGEMLTQGIGSGLSGALSNLGGSGALGEVLNVFGTTNDNVNAIGEQAGGIMNYATQLVDSNTNTDAKCEGIKNLWDDIKGKGVVKIPKLTMADMLNSVDTGSFDLGNLPAGIQGLLGVTGDAQQAAENNPHLQTFKKNLEASASVFQDLKAAMDALPGPTPPINFQDVSSSCQVLATAGIVDASSCN